MLGRLVKLTPGNNGLGNYTIADFLRTRSVALVILLLRVPNPILLWIRHVDWIVRFYLSGQELLNW
ncbi:hypothetical protein U1Q18_045699, partial [Sarracenia purpurea var. burkii]